MKWSVRPWFVTLVALIASLAATSAAAQADGPRATEITPFSYEDLARWILEVRPEVAERPISLVLLFNNTDSVWGLGAGYQVLPNVWATQLLRPLLHNFLVQGYERPDGIVQGDRVTMLGFGRRGLTELLPERPFTRAATLEIANAYEGPYRNTPPELWEVRTTNEILEAAIARTRARDRDDNVLLLLMTDNSDQSDGSLRMPAARAYRTYMGFLGTDLYRDFAIHLYWNDFPNDVRFTYYDEASDSVLPHPRTERAAAQRDSLLPSERFGTTETPPLPQALTGELAGGGQKAFASPDLNVRLGDLGDTRNILLVRSGPSLFLARKLQADQGFTSLQVEQVRPHDRGTIGFHRVRSPDTSFAYADGRLFVVDKFHGTIEALEVFQS